jgi:hypothetical protein
MPADRWHIVVFDFRPSIKARLHGTLSMRNRPGLDDHGQTRGIQEQKEICKMYGATFSPPLPDQLIAISKRVLDGFPLAAGVRYRDASTGKSGWIVYSSDSEEETSEFVGIHADHLAKTHPAVARHLALPVGWRFALEPGSERAWFDGEVQAEA